MERVSKAFKTFSLFNLKQTLKTMFSGLFLLLLLFYFSFPSRITPCYFLPLKSSFSSSKMVFGPDIYLKTMIKPHLPNKSNYVCTRNTQVLWLCGALHRKKRLTSALSVSETEISQIALLSVSNYCQGQGHLF